MLIENSKDGTSPKQELPSKTTAKESDFSHKPSSLKIFNHEHVGRENESSSKRISGSHGKRQSDQNSKNSPDEKKVSNEKDEGSKLDESTVEPSKADIAETSNVNISLNKILIDDVSHLKTLVKEKYLVQIPDEFFTFWNLCRKLSPKNPKGKNLAL